MENKKKGYAGNIHLNFDSLSLNNIRFHENQFTRKLYWLNQQTGGLLSVFPLEIYYSSRFFFFFFFFLALDPDFSLKCYRGKTHLFRHDFLPLRDEDAPGTRAILVPAFPFVSLEPGYDPVISAPRAFRFPRSRIRFWPLGINFHLLEIRLLHRR